MPQDTKHYIPEALNTHLGAKTPTQRLPSTIHREYIPVAAHSPSIARLKMPYEESQILHKCNTGWVQKGLRSQATLLTLLSNANKEGNNPVPSSSLLCSSRGQAKEHRRPQKLQTLTERKPSWRLFSIASSQFSSLKGELNAPPMQRSSSPHHPPRSHHGLGDSDQR